jgi:hypothetical protein
MVSASLYALIQIDVGKSSYHHVSQNETDGDNPSYQHLSAKCALHAKRIAPKAWPERCLVRRLEVHYRSIRKSKRKFRVKGTLMILRPVLSASLLVFALCFLVVAVGGQEVPGPGAKPATAMPSVVQVPSEAQPSDHFDAVAATNAYLAQIPSDARSRSDAYFEGGYWLILWDFLYGAIVYILLLQLRWSADGSQHGSREWNCSGQGVSNRRFSTNHPHERQCQRHRSHHAHHSQ